MYEPWWLHYQIETNFTQNKTEMASPVLLNVYLSVDYVYYRIYVLRNFNLILYRAARHSHVGFVI